jgi:cytochrome c oxidase subunit 2|tara:strand:- start:3496 stop:3984 length:489 start_codon:yes stop_codon:yes gene_type:complete
MSKLLWGVVLGALIVIVGGFFLFSSSDSSIDEGSSLDTSNSQANVETDDSSTTTDSTTGSNTNQDDSQTTQETKEFTMTAKKWDFSPSTITVNEGDKVILNVESIDVTHGIAIPDFGVSESLSPGNTVKIEFTADKKGSFSFFCNVFCGSGHGGMSGTLIVQ